MSVFHSGFAAVIGKPNVGKSTLANLLVGEKISIISSKPQTTRNKIRSIVTGADYQVILIDTPGIHKPDSKLGAFMQKSWESAMNEVDVILYLVEPRRADDPIVFEKLKRVKTPVFLVVNKIDTTDRPNLLLVIDAYRKLCPFQEIIPISALKGENTDDLLSAIVRVLPEGPMYFPRDMVTDQPEKQIACEMIREKALRFLREEVPHGIAVAIGSMQKRSGQELVDIDATIFCERDSHKGILIGRGGEMLKKIGAAARMELQRLLGSPIYLQLWVKVKKDWRDSDFDLRNFGYDAKHF